MFALPFTADGDAVVRDVDVNILRADAGDGGFHHNFVRGLVNIYRKLPFRFAGKRFIKRIVLLFIFALFRRRAHRRSER